MTTKTLTGIYGSAYNLTSPITTLSITASGYLNNSLLAAGAGTYTIVNNGVIKGHSYGVSLAGTGIVTNSGTIQSTVTGRGILLGNGGVVMNGGAGDLTAQVVGYRGVQLNGSPGTVINSGTIIGFASWGIQITDSGTVTNGAGGATKALIEGGHGNGGAIYIGLGGTVRNYGTVVGMGTSGIAVALVTGGSVTNGSASDTAAMIQAADYGVRIDAAPGLVNNFATVQAIKASAIGVELNDGGLVTNGGATDTVALIAAPDIAVEITGASGTVNNFATIGGPTEQGAVFLTQGGAVTNGGTADTGALIEAGNNAVSVFGHSGTVKNFGTIRAGEFGILGAGIYLTAGGVVTNGSASVTTAFIQGYSGVVSSLVAATVINFGTVEGVDHGVNLIEGGRITNGSATDTSALIKGYIGTSILDAGGTLANYGTIAGGVAKGYGAILNPLGNPARLTNGTSADRTALITGHIGVDVVSGIVINNATISGNASPGSLGLYLSATGASATNGSATNATALITGYTGAMLAAGTTLTNFATIQAGASNDAVLFNASTCRLNAEGGSVIVGDIVDKSGGIVDVVSGVALASGIVSAGQVIGAGTLGLNGGQSVLYYGTSLAVAEIEVLGGAGVYMLATLTDAKIWNQSSGSLTVHAFDQVTFTGVGDSFSGTISGAGTVALSGGSDTLSNVLVATAKTTISKAAVTFSGSVGVTGTVTATSTSLVVAAGGATFSGGGTISLSNLATNSLYGASSTATLTNGDIIRGAGHLGGGVMTLVNAATGIIEGGGTAGLSIDTGTNTIANAGLIEALSGETTTIASAVANTGHLTSFGGTLVVNGAVTGAGSVKVLGGVVDLAGAFNEAVAFGSSGRLILAHSAAYTASITGFSHTGTTSLDLQDIKYGFQTSSFSGTTTSGVLTVSDGTHTAHIHLIGDYTAANWIFSNDASGGTIVVDPTAPKAAAQAHALVAAAAGLGGASPGSGHLADRSWRAVQPALAAPGVHWA